MNTRSHQSKVRIMESPALRVDRSCYRLISPANPVKRDANIKGRILGSLNSFVLAASRRTYRQRRAFRVVSHLWTIATVRPLRFLGVLLVLYAMVGSNIFSPAKVPADAVRVLLWLFVSGVVALVVDEVCERITREAREVMDRKERENEQKPNVVAASAAGDAAADGGTLLVRREVIGNPTTGSPL